MGKKSKKQYIVLPVEEEAEGQALGVQFDSRAKKWYIPDDHPNPIRVLNRWPRYKRKPKPIRFSSLNNKTTRFFANS